MTTYAPPQGRRSAGSGSSLSAFTFDLKKTISMELTEEYTFEVPMDFRKATEERRIEGDPFVLHLRAKCHPSSKYEGMTKVEINIRGLRSKTDDLQHFTLEGGAVFSSEGEEKKYITHMSLDDPGKTAKMKFSVVDDLREKGTVWLRIVPARQAINDDQNFADTLRTRMKPLDVSLLLYNARDSTGDSIIKTKTEVFKVHQCVLSARSEVFMAMLNTEMKEGREKLINMEHFDACVVRSSIEFMYLGCTRALVDDPESMLELAHMYQLKDLLSNCWENLIDTMSPATTVKLLLLVEKYGDIDQRDRIATYLLDNHDAAMRTPLYATLVKDHLDLYLRICGTPVEH